MADPMELTQRRLAAQTRIKAPQCPYCDAIAPYGDARHVWLRAHLDSRLHRSWWVLVRTFQKVRNFIRKFRRKG